MSWDYQQNQLFVKSKLYYMSRKWIDPIVEKENRNKRIGKIIFRSLTSLVLFIWICIFLTSCAYVRHTGCAYTHKHPNKIVVRGKTPRHYCSGNLQWYNY